MSREIVSVRVVVAVTVIMFYASMSNVAELQAAE